MTTITGIDPRSGKTLDVRVDNGSIASIADSSVETDLYIAPGLIDLQVNGFGGHDLNEPNLAPQTVYQVAQKVLQTGVTTFLPTLITQSEGHLLASLHAIRESAERFSLVRKMVAGIHMEGPFISPEDGFRGAHPRQHVRPPCLDEVNRWQVASGNLVRLVTLSPHWENAGGVIAELRRRGIHVAIGHTHADSGQIHAAAGAGAELSTHLGNGIAATLSRHPNAIWAQLAEDRLSATFIADSHHFDRDTLKTMLRSKGLMRSILISDAVALAGMLPGIYDTAVGGEVELTTDGRLSIYGTPYLAGAACSLAHCLNWLLESANVSLQEAIAMATTNPSSFAGVPCELQAGNTADIILFRSSPTQRLAIHEVWLHGERCQSTQG